ncbi:midasin isoform X2 [Leptidea sinapis]|uniref:midasin isoform X2 n=1 Tax=Leptidea sinapis TaxID=189913 RepID=UPI0021C3FCFA|nr:midasin isoform X2 [Leptidea sinapis]
MDEKLLAALRHIQEETKDKELTKTCQKLRNCLRDNPDSVDNIIQSLAEYVVNFDDVLLFRKYLSNFLLALVSKKIVLKPVFISNNHENATDCEKTNHMQYSIVLGLLSDHPDILQYAQKYFQINPIPPYEIFIHHEDSYNVAPKKRRLQDFRQKISDHHLVSCCYKLLSKLPSAFSMKWDWTKFVINFSHHENDEIRWMVKECMVILTYMTESQSKTLSRNLNVSDETNLKNLFRENETVLGQSCDNANIKTDSVVNVDGIVLPIYDKENVQDGNLVKVKSTINNLRSLALAVASGKALSLMGPVGSGKTSLVEYLAAVTGRKGIAFKKVQLGDQTDSRMLLGSHQCTDIPGEFIWAPGVLTEAVQNGHWLLLEDIDSAALDVASTLSSLLERNTLCVPGYRDVLPVTPGFQLFVTQRTVATNFGFQRKTSSSSALLQKHLTVINVEPLSRSELAEVVQTLYPSLTTITPKMIEVFMMFSVGCHDTSIQTTEAVDSENTVPFLRGSRLISTRDLMKWCARAVSGFNVCSADSALKVLQDSFDIFTCSVSSPENRLQLAKKVGTCLGIVETKAEFYCKHYKPHVSLQPSSLVVGRATIPRLEKSLESIDFENKEVVFSFTRQSACLLERIACCVVSNEPVLLVGETGTGKTSSVQYLAKQTGHKLIVINMNQQSDSADLLGGYKPVDLKYVIRPIKSEFVQLFKSFYNMEKNQKFLNHIETCYDSENWSALLALMKQSHNAAIKRLTADKKEKKLKLWLSFGYKLNKLEQQVKAESRLTFAFIEGSLVKAMQEGYWVLLDEINLASAEILECLAGLLEDKNENVELLEKGDKVPIKRHPDFTLFACMNPATDVGKKDLPVGLRNRFTEFFIDELTEKTDLMLLIGDYLYHMNLSGAVLESIYSFYSSIRKEAKLNLVDGAGNAPHYSLRTLCRALTAAAKAKCGPVARSLYEAFCLSFLTQLDRASHPKVEAMIAKAVLGKRNINSVLKQMIPEPQTQGQNYLLFEGHWIPQGNLEIDIPEGYILTTTVRKNLRDIARIISLGRLPILLQGDTSVGKTSLITYIAKASGNYCVRINNHEHTDLQEYIGSYATDANGSLVFKEGVLVEAMRKGYWIILDELNLAPSDVLEALNRVLDDNRELFIPETQEVVRADPNFMLFATQNPPGLYGGRKVMSRAFRNRFVELHFDEIPRNELETILHQRCHIPPTYSKKMIEVMAELQVRRRGSAAVQGKDGFITLRDLFRWGQRYKHASKETLTSDKFYDWDQHIADEGYLILAGKVRQVNERNIIEEVIEKHIKRKIDPENLFTLHENTSAVTKSILETILNNQLPEFSHLVWTYNMRRLAVLIAKAFSFDEPVLLVGETGCGKTTICQVLAAMSGRSLLSVNCHMHTESSDFIGGLRPVRQYKNDGRLFEWVDGPLIKSMENGSLFLADEISLADDSVLERMNSLLEPERQLVLSERGTDESSDIVVIKAIKNFHFIGTMNPGGDFGKKELSPALRNRFTEIWCDHISARSDLLKVLEKSVSNGIILGNDDRCSGISNCILDFTEWLKTSEVTNKFPFSIRDLLSWVQFINLAVGKKILDPAAAYVHGACMTFLDCFGTALTGHVDSETLFILRKNAISFLVNQIKTFGYEDADKLKDLFSNKTVSFSAGINDQKFGIKPFYIDLGDHMNMTDVEKFTFTTPTTGANTLRILRGLQLNKAILLEGNPGVGKTSLVTALAMSSGHRVVRINLSDQTDITDLFGTDLPSEDGSFVFKEGVFLNALQNGDWILLDELNLAPQPVLEGLNACLDHRGEIFIPELGKTFKVKQQTKLFACQNPLKQGGARRGLPVSFLNRFTQVYIDTMTKDDLKYIVEAQYSQLPKDILHRIVEFNCKVSHEIIEIQSWGHRGAPWEMNLRDVQRWCEALVKDQSEGKKVSPGKFVDMIYVNRMRTLEDKEKMINAYNDIFYPLYPRSDDHPMFCINNNIIHIGDVSLPTSVERSYKNKRVLDTNLLILRSQLPYIKALAQNVKMNWLTILVGPTAVGKSSLVQVLADLTGNELHVIPVTTAMDISDLLGGFEQVDWNRNLENLYDDIESLTLKVVRDLWLLQDFKIWKSNKLLSDLYEYKYNKLCVTEDKSSNLDRKQFMDKIRFLTEHCDKLIDSSKICNLPTDNINKTMKNLANLLSKISKMSSVNAGGRFEWIDSLLVKTMIEGSWLLLDNVNLTSAAVLDRLNGLLEQNGVLSIPERGEINEIRPHHNFRVFFTMDPKHGEISRAMRNRGVEIYILRPDNLDLGLSETLPYMDLVALLLSCGLPNKYHDICIRCHETMTEFVQGIDRPTVSHLLQAAHLIRQQLVRGFSFKTALLNSFSDVYIKPRSGNDFSSNITKSLAEMKNYMLEELENELGSESFDSASTDNVSHTLTIQGLCANSEYEIAKQIAYAPIKQANDDDASIETALHCLFTMLITHQNCPRDVATVYHRLVNKAVITSGSKLRELAQELNEIALKFSINSKHQCESYKRNYEESYEIDSDVIHKSNKIFSLLYNEFQKVLIQLYYTQNSFCALDYSEAVLSSKITDDFVQYPILKQCKRFVEIIDDNIVKAFEKCEKINDANVCAILQLLNWRNRFKKACTVPIFNATKQKRAPILNEDTIPLLQVHNKWIQKYLFAALYNMLGNTEDIETFKKNVSNMNLGTQEDYSEIGKVGKKIRKCYGQSKLFKDQNEYNLCLARSETYEKIHLDMNQPIDKQLYKVSVCVLSASKLFAVDIPNETSIKTIEEDISKLQQHTKDACGVNSSVKLVPIKLYIMNRLLTMLSAQLPELLRKFFATEDILMMASENNALEVLSSLIEYGKVVNGFPRALLDQLNVLLELRKGNPDVTIERLSSLPTKFWDEFYKMLTTSPVVHPLLFLNSNFDRNSTAIEDIPSNSPRFSMNLPLMSYYIQQLTTFIDGEGTQPRLIYEKVSLKDRVEYSLQLRSILSVLWKNIATLQSTAAYKMKSDARFEMKKYEHFIIYLHSTILTKHDNPIVKTTDDKISLVTKYFKDTKHFLDILIKADAIYKELREELSSRNEEKLKMKMLTSQLSVALSIMYLQFMAEVNPIDHVEKYRMKVEYIEEDVKMFNTLLSSYYVQGIVSGTIEENRNIEKSSQVTLNTLNDVEKKEQLKKVHPYCAILMKLRDQTAMSIQKYASGNTFRPKEPSYSSFAKECKHFVKSVLSEKTISMITSNMTVICNQLYDDFKTNTFHKSSLQKAHTIAKEAMSWLHSIKAFYKKIQDSYSEAFPDLAKPLQASLSQIIYSITTFTDLVKEIIVKIEQGPSLPDILRDLMVFPNKISKRHTKESDLNRFNTSEFMQLVIRQSTDSDGNLSNAEAASLEILKMNLSELSMYTTSRERVDNTTVNAVLSTLNGIVAAWERQRQDIEKKKQDDEALYVTKSKCEDEDEEAIASEEIKEMFPSFSDLDFAEFKPPTLEQRKIKPPVEKPKPLITSEDVSLIYKWHSNFVHNFTVAEWLASPKKLVGHDVANPLLLRYPIFSRVVQNAWPALDVEFESEISPSLLVLLSHIKSRVDGIESSNVKFDFYRSEWVSETRECLPLLHKVKEATEELLEQWPDFPSLKDIMVIVNRIMSFPITSPVSRFLTGLELLRDKIEEWNKNAHKGNNMIEISLAVGQQIINWRKLEMSHWKECLNSVFHRKQSDAHKYWFYMYSVVTSYLDTQSSEEVTSPRVIAVLRDFMEKSNVAEYEVRLNIVYVYHCHLVHLEPSTRRDELISILWNTYNYYLQFTPQVATFIKEKRTPIEKKLRDFVKICTWDRDLSYWSVKDTVDKAHKALHKHTKEFEKVITESVSRCLVDGTNKASVDHVGIWDRPKRVVTANNPPAGGAYMIDVQLYIVLARNIKKYMDQAEEPCSMLPENSLLTKIPSLLNKTKQLCKDTISNSGYPTLVQALDDFITVLIETSTHLGSLEVDITAPKDKQKSQAKNIVQQKRKALADLFKYLSKMGLNYRTGLVIVAASAELYDFTIPPVDLHAAMSYLKNRRCDPTLSMLWSGCEKYFQKNIARHRLFTAALQSPHADLGMQNIERCKGFAAQLMKLTGTQKKSIAKYTRYVTDLRIVTTSLTNALELNLENVNIVTLNEKLNILADCYSRVSITLDQFSIVLKSLPEKGFDTECEPTFDLALSNSLLPQCFNDNDEWRELYKQVKAVRTMVDKQKAAIFKLTNSTLKHVGNNIGEIPIVSQSHIDTVDDAFNCLEAVKEKINAILIEYNFDFKCKIEDDQTCQHPLLRSLIDLDDYLSNTIDDLNKIDKVVEETMEDEKSRAIMNQAEDIVANMLLIIQSVYKKHLKSDQSNDCMNVINEIDEIIGDNLKDPSNEILEDGHLKELLQKQLAEDGKLLQLDFLIERLKSLLINYVDYISKRTNIEEVRLSLARIVPILEQILLFVQYFMSQKVAVHRVSCKMLSVLLKIFSDLATKGFCKPSDLDMEEGDGEDGSGKLSSGTGLGEGEGQKDVSERIENQDQLDDAHRPGEEKKEEDRDCKEEEKGVNMTDDFDSHLQDLENKEGEESDEEKDNDDVDKQMGDTDNAADKLDQQIWGSEDEEDVDESADKKEKEERGKGESTGEKEMGAKDEEDGADDGSLGKEKKQKKDINEMNEEEVDDDHVDKYHGNEEKLPEPEDFDMDDMNVDGDDNEQDKDGETETENPFDIDVMKQNITEEEPPKESEEKESNRDGLDVSSDEDNAQDDGEGEPDNEETNKEETPNEKESQGNEDEENAKEEDNTEIDSDKDDSQEQESEPDVKDPENLKQNPDAIEDEDDNVVEKPHEANPQANPSNEDPSTERGENAEMDRGASDNVETNAEQDKDDDAVPYEQAQEEVGEEKQSTGRSELDKSEKGHRGEKQAAKSESALDTNQKYENKPGKSDQERTLGEVNETQHKQARTLNVEREQAEEEGGEERGEDGEREADAFQHVKQASERDVQAVDAATKEQAEQQPMLQQNDEKGDELKEGEEVPMDIDEDIQVEKSEEIKPEPLRSGTEKDKEKTGNKDGGEEPTGEGGVEVEGENVLTANVPRGRDTTYHTRLEEQAYDADAMPTEQYISMRTWVEGGGQPSAAWRAAWRDTAGAARALCETLRLVLEPTVRSRRAGDYRTGRAINMRRVIPYIASHFRKDRIWLRRTKPARRDYKIAIAVDDSSSMADNRSRELAFESLALVSQALNLLESGDLAVLSFGEKPNLLHPFNEQFSEHSGAKILEHLRFEQTKTRIAQLLDFCSVMFEQQAMRSEAVNARLLVVVSDGRGIFSEGEGRVIQAVRRARTSGVFLVYVIIDNPDNKDSIMDIRRPLLDPVTNSLSGFVPYLDTFPFPFYLILRDIAALPTVLGDALRQWFELAANTAS